MARNLHCGCLCHGTDGNVTDSYFSCKNCYAANHMGNLPRQTSDAPKPKGKKEHKGKAAPRPKRPTGTETAPVKKFTPAQAAVVTSAIKEAMEAVHVCGDGTACKHD